MMRTPGSTGGSPGVAGPADGTGDEESRWEHAAAAVLRRARRLAEDAPDAAAWGALTTRSLDGVPIPPLGTAGRSAAPLPGVRDGRPASGWDVRPLSVGGDAARVARDAVTDLENGASSVWLPIGGAGIPVATLPVALADVYLEMAPVVLSAQGEVSEIAVARALVDLTRARGVRPEAGTNLGADPVGLLLRRGNGPDGPDAATVAAMGTTVRTVGDLAGEAGTLALVVDATAAHDRGAAEVGELGYSLALGATYLRMLTTGMDVATAAALIEFRYTATADQFLTVAKLRAARALWSRVLELCGVPPGAVRQRQHVVSSRPMTTRYDPWVNLLRGTVAAFAAGVGGADAVTVLPYDTALGAPSPLGRRLARNTSALLISEAHVARVQDPAGGAHAVELLTSELADRGWADFQALEARGGLLAALADGSLTAAFDATAAERRRRIADRRQPITGVTTFPDATEEPRTPPPADDAEPPGWAADFEQLRDRAAGAGVRLVTLGSAAEHHARAVFVENALAAAGLWVTLAPAGSPDTTAEPAAVVCLAGTDAAYREDGPAVMASLRAAGARWIVLAGRPPAELVDLVDDHLAAGADLLGPLQRIQAALARAGSSRDGVSRAASSRSGMPREEVAR